MKRQFDESQLVNLLKANDRVAFEYLYDNYSGALYNVICRIVNDRETATEVLQDTFVKIWKSIGSYEPAKGSLFTWMLNISRHRAIDVYRSKRRQALHVDLVSAEINSELYAFAVLPLFELHDINQLLDRLRPEQKRLIDLVYIQGFTHEEVSKMVMLPLGTVKSRIRKSLKLLKLHFEALNTSLKLVS